MLTARCDAQLFGVDHFLPGRCSPLGAIVRLDERGDIAVHTDSGRLVEFHLKNHPHLDHGYAVTSHSSQGQTADRVLIHADTEESAHS